MNPILNQLFNSNAAGIFNLFSTVKKANNPNMMMQSLMQTNPQIKEVMNYVNQNGGNAKQLFYSMAQQKGVDPNSIIEQLKNL